MKIFKLIIGIIYTILLYLIYVIDKVLKIPFTQAIPNFKTWAFDERGKLHRQNSIIRVLTVSYTHLTLPTNREV